MYPLYAYCRPLIFPPNTVAQRTHRLRAIPTTLDTELSCLKSIQILSDRQKNSKLVHSILVGKLERQNLVLKKYF